MKENETLNEENIRLNKINIQMETLVDYYEKNNKSNNIKDKSENNLNQNKKNKIIKSNTFFDDNNIKDKIIINSESKDKHQKKQDEPSGSSCFNVLMFIRIPQPCAEYA